MVLLTIAILGLNGCLAFFVPQFMNWPVDTHGYTIEELPVAITASFVQGGDVYLGTPDRRIFKANDADLSEPWVQLNCPFDMPPRLLFVSRAGTIFTSACGQATYRSDDTGQSWQECLGFSVWRMEEDDLGSIYAGNYTKDSQHVATVYKSTDQGVTWTKAFEDKGNHHIHTIRWDNQAKRLYIAFGDNRSRGQAYSDDRGDTWKTIARGPKQGHTDLGITNDYVIWASDDKSGRVFRIDRGTETSRTIMFGLGQLMWFVIAQKEQIYIGTIVSDSHGSQRAVLLASDNQGDSWQKLLETDLSESDCDKGFLAESRVLSQAGWFYFSEAKWLECTSDGPAYRIKRNSN